jgi:16S rRNA (uracil1498-N3)-methyltransferase
LEKLKLFSATGLEKSISTVGTHLACLEKGERKSLKEVTQIGLLVPPIHIWIGPEGGWDDEEINFFRQNNLIPVTLGPLVLRAETAALHAVSTVSTLI